MMIILLILNVIKSNVFLNLNTKKMLKNQDMNYKIYSFVNDDLNTDVKLYQKRVFDKFNIDINQVVWKKDFEKYGYVILND